MNISFNPLVRVRTVTAFVNLSADKAQWQAGLTQAKQQCDAVADAIEALGYQVQSIRIVSNPFGEYLDVCRIDSALAGKSARQLEFDFSETFTATRLRPRRLLFPRSVTRTLSGESCESLSRCSIRKSIRARVFAGSCAREGM